MGFVLIVAAAIGFLVAGFTRAAWAVLIAVVATVGAMGALIVGGLVWAEPELLWLPVALGMLGFIVYAFWR